MSSPGLYWIGMVGLECWVVEQPRDKEREGVSVSLDGMLLSIGGFGLLILGDLGCWWHQMAMEVDDSRW